MSVENTTENASNKQTTSNDLSTVESSSITQEIDYSKALSGRLIMAAFIANISTFILGSALGWTAVVQPQLQQLPGSHVSVTDEESIWYIELNDDEMSWVGAVINIGALIGALIGGFLTDKFGRKVVLIIISLPSVLGWLFFIFTVHSSMLYIGRILIGFAGGLSTVACPLYVDEITTPKLRGPLGCFLQLMVCFGLVVSSLLGLGLDWRWISTALAVPSLLLLVSMIYLPETPYFLLKKGQIKEAEKALRWYRGPSHNIGSEMAQMQQRLQIELNQNFKLTDLHKPWAFKPVFVVFLMMFLYQFSGINPAVFNAVAIFDASGWTLDPLVSNIILSVDQFIAVFFSFYLVERLGRQLLYILSMAIMGLSMFALGTFFYIQEFYEDPTIAESIGWLPLTSLLVYVSAFCIGIGTVSWILIGELLPAKVRGLGGSVAASTSWLSSFVITKTFIDIQRSLTRAGSFWFFGGFCILGVLFGAFVLPETKGKSPEDVQKHFGIKPPTQ